jgi:putative sterol carrier protein
MKKSGTVFKGKAQPKADVTIILSDDTLIDLANGKVIFTPSCQPLA